MKKLKLKNAKIEKLTEAKVTFVGELKGCIQRLSYTITPERFSDLQQLDNDKKYNIWKTDDNFRFIECR